MMRPEHVYFIRSLADGRIKIGYSNNVPRRMKQIGGVIELLGCVPGTIHDEQRIHTRFKAYLVYSEWFDDHPDIRAFLRDNGLPSDRLHALLNPPKTSRVICGCGKCSKCLHRLYMRAKRAEDRAALARFQAR